MDVGQHDVLLGLGEAQPLRIEAGLVGGEHVAAPGLVGLHHVVVGCEGDGLQRHLVGAEVIGKVELGRRSLPDADRGSPEFKPGLYAERLAHDEALAVVIGGAGEVEAE